MEDGKVVCTFIDEDDIDESHAHIFVVGIYCSGDLKWYATILGMDGMSGKWCIYCYLRKLGWTQLNHVCNPRTIDNMEQYDNPSLSVS